MKPYASGTLHEFGLRIRSHPAFTAGLLSLALLSILAGQIIAAMTAVSQLQLASARMYAQFLATCKQFNSGTPTEESLRVCLNMGLANADGRIILLESSGRLLAGNRGITEVSLREQPLSAAADGTSFISRTPGGAATHVAVAAVPGTDVILVLQQPLLEVLGRHVNLLLLVVIPGILALALMNTALFLVIDGIRKPLRELARQAQHLENLVPKDSQSAQAVLPEISQLGEALAQAGRFCMQHRANVQTYALQVTEVQEAERNRLAHDLHDETMQGLVAIGQRLQLAQRAIEQHDNPGTAMRLEQARELNQLVMDSLRRTIRALRPVTLEGAGLLPALESLAEETRSADLNAALVVQGEPRALSKEVELAVFRVAQEALTNVLKHARASRVTMLAQYDTTQFVLEINDDGIGFALPPTEDAYALNGQYGLLGMRERLFAIGGLFTIESARGRGTRVRAAIPYESAAAACGDDRLP